MNDSERLDGDVLGEEIGDDGLPGVGDYPAEQAVGVNDPNLVAADDVAMREARTRGEEQGSPEEVARDLLPPDGDDGFADAERQAVAAEPDADGDPAVPAEVAAIHVAPE